MLFPTVAFALFFAAVLGIFWLLRAFGHGWKLFLIGASYFFYAYWDARFVLLLATLTAGNYLLGLAVARSRRRIDGAAPDDRDRRIWRSRLRAVTLPPISGGSGDAPALNWGGRARGWFSRPSLFATRALAVAQAPAMPLLSEAAVAAPVSMPVAVPSVVVAPPVTPDADGRIAGRYTRWILAGALLFNLGMLGWFKYYEFFSTSLVNALARFGIDVPLPLLQVTLPIGISFITFQAMSYVIDISRGTIRPMRAVDFATYLAFFPHLVAGPIVRASEFGPQLEHPADSSAIPATAAFMLILSGLFKKVVISSFLAREVVDPVFAVPGQHSGPEILFATYGYAIQIFADFSGYTDIAIGCALLLGFRLPQNFNAPYAAGSLQDFWRRWHMSLSRWIRDYLFIPLGGSHGSRIFTARNLMITFVLAGLWHGAAWTFAVWGAIHGVGLIIERAVRGRLGEPPGRAWVIARWLVTFHVVCLAWIFFRAESVSAALDMVRRIFTSWGAAPIITPLAVLAVGGMLALQFVPGRWNDTWQSWFARLSPVIQAVVLALGLMAVDAMGPKGVAPFIYFRF